MDHDAALEAVTASLRRIAPEISLDEVDHDADLLEELELDSMDFLAFVTDLHERTGVEIPESDYPKLSSVEAVLGYLVSGSTTTRTDTT